MHYQHYCGPEGYGFSGHHHRRSGFGPFGRSRRGPGGGGFGFGRMFRDGDLKLIVLALIEHEPRHGYDIIKALEGRSGGFYSPSPGVVYPTLTYLEEVGYVTASADGAKRVYTIAEAGIEHLDKSREHVEAVLDQMEAFGEKMQRAKRWFDQGEDSPDEREPTSAAMKDLDQARQRLRALIVAATEGTEADQVRVAEILQRAADEVLGKKPSN